MAGVIKGIGIGETTIHYRRGDIFKEITVVVDTSFPLIKGQPFVVKADGPSELWFRDFDRGGKNIAFYDTGGGSGNTYRADMGDFTSSMVTMKAAATSAISTTASGISTLLTSSRRALTK